VRHARQTYSSTRRKGKPESAQLVIVDDHDFVRESTKDMLADEQDMRVAGEAANGLEALDLCRHLRPDVVLMDVRMPVMDGLEATRQIKREHPQTSVLMVTTFENPDYLLEAIKAGAAGYVLKDATQEDLVSAVRRVLCGESPLNQELAARLLRRLSHQVREQAEVASIPRRADLLQPLSPRELEVLEMLALGWTNRQIAQDFYITTGTVKNHVEHIIAKLGVSDRTHAVVRALKLGLISFPER